MKPPKFVLRRKENSGVVLQRARRAQRTTENHREMQGWPLLESLAIWATASDCDLR